MKVMFKTASYWREKRAALTDNRTKDEKRKDVKKGALVGAGAGAAISLPMMLGTKPLQAVAMGAAGAANGAILGGVGNHLWQGHKNKMQQEQASL